MIDSNSTNDPGIHGLLVGIIRLLGLVRRRLSWVAGSLFSGLFGWD
jgi:hypothetical protein